MEFFAVSWRGDDITSDNTNEEEEDDGVSDKQYKISIFGKTIEGNSVCCTVPFNPFFFVALPDAFKTAADAMHIRDRIMSKMGRRFRSSVVVDACVMVRRKPFYGFSNGVSRPFLCMVFRTRHAYAVASKIITTSDDLKLYESNVDPVLKLIHCRDLDSAGWIRIAAWKKSEPSVSGCTLDIEARHEDLHRSSSPEKIPPLVMASFDIEANSHDGGFPNPDLEGNEVIQIGTVFQRYGESEPFAREILCLGRTSEIHGVDVRCFETEPELLAAWSKSLRKHHADILIGYNVWGFDLQFMYKRSMFNYDDEKHRLEFLNIGKLARGLHQSSLRKTVLSSSAYGHNEFMILETPGILQIDLMHVLQKEHKLESYSLNNVSKHFLGDTKLDMPARKMFDLYATKDPDNLRQIAEYCIKDCELPLLLMTKLAVVPNMIEMAKATHVPMEFLIPRGQQIKVFSQILKRLRDRGYVCPANPKRPSNSTEGYVGATVLEPKRGAYMDHPIATLDFASLYPSIMRSSRLCPSTIVLNPKYANVPGVEYMTIDVEGVEYKFAQNTEAIVPDLLRDLAEYRKQAKKDMAQAKKDGDAFMTSVYDGKQMAIKVSMNSVYGFFGAANGFLPCAPIAAAVTTIGRQMIEATKNFVEDQYPGSEVVYGDSVMPYTPIFVKHATTGFVSIRRIDQVFRPEAGVAYDGFLVDGTDKQRYEPREPLLTWTHLGWQPIRRVIRHLMGPDKKVYRVRTRTALVDVTEDHSLLDPDGNLLKPQDVGPGTRLMHGVPPVSSSYFGGPEGEDYQVAAQHAFMKTSPSSKESGDVVTDVGVLLETGRQYYVYDLETEAGSFQAGVGGLIVKNTDSVMIKFGPQDVETCFRLGQEAANAATKLFKDPVKLEFEKVFHPYFLFAKKRYCGVKITSLDDDPVGVLDYKGIQLARRDNCPMVRTVSRKVLDALMFQRDPSEATRIVRGVTKDLLENKIDVKDLVLSKTLKPESSYKNPNQPHVYVARKIEQRNGMVGSGPRSGERVPYVFVEDENPLALQCAKAEDPAYAAEHGLRIDALYYLEHQLESPMVSLFELLISDPQGALFDDLKESYVRRRKEELKEYKRKEKLKKNKQHEITMFFRKSAASTATSSDDPR
jgi:DNA polymerase elongation subunit (family B)